MARKLVLIDCYDGEVRARKCLSVRLSQVGATRSDDGLRKSILVIHVSDESGHLLASLKTVIRSEIRTVKVNRP